MKPMADTHIKYNDHSINSAFKNHYIVPDYQREYVWKDEQVEFFVDEKELDLIKQKMAQMGTDNMSAYLRKMAIDGYVVNLDMPELRELTSKMKRISNSENQFAKQLNTTGNIYEADIEEIKKNQEEIYEGIKKILLSLSHLK